MVEQAIGASGRRVIGSSEQMQTAIGISLLVLGWVTLVLANFLHMHAEVELLEKRPELANVLNYGKWFRRPNLWETKRLYKSEFPNGRGIRNSWMFAAAAFLAFISGILLLAHLN